MSVGKRIWALPNVVLRENGSAAVPVDGIAKMRASLPRPRNKALDHVAQRHVAATALLGLILGFGCVAAGTTFVQASERSGIFGFFEDIFRPAPPLPVRHAERSPKRYASLPTVHRITEPRTRHFTPRPSLDLSTTLHTRSSSRMRAAERVPVAMNGPQTVCVRTCDGYMFPLGRLRSQIDIPVHQAACAAACPSAQTALFTLPGRSHRTRSVRQPEGSSLSRCGLGERLPAEARAELLLSATGHRRRAATDRP